jgi:hypothetical protein
MPPRRRVEQRDDEGSGRATHDIDTWTSIEAGLAAAAASARAATGLDVPLRLAE